MNTPAALHRLSRPSAYDTSGKVLQESAFTQSHTCHYPISTFFLNRQNITAATAYLVPTSLITLVRT